MRGVMCALWLLMATAQAGTPRLDLGIGALTARRATSSATTPAIGLAASTPVVSLLEVRADTAISTFVEENTAGRLDRTVWRSAVTADLVTTRQSVSLRLGLGPAIEVQPVYVAGAGEWSGTRVLLGGRAHLGLSGAITSRIGWRGGVGATLTLDGPGYDALGGVTLALGQP